MDREAWSFDVFDTCLVRRHAFPTDVFLDVAFALRDRLEPLLGTDFQQVFREARVEAEKRALKRCGSEEATLSAIWSEVRELLPGIDTSTGMAAELELERRTLAPVISTVKLVNAARSQFGAVAFISDTYLPSDFVRARLAEHGFLREGDFCFVSSEYGVTKRTGRLFEVVMARLEVDAARLRHFGDNVATDVLPARRLGIRSTLVNEANLSRHERAIGERLTTLDDRVSGRLIGAIRAARVGEAAGSSSASRSFATIFLGPFLWILADWLLSRASRDGTDVLYFFSRDCHALYQVSSLLARRRGLKLECRYLQVSRQALLLPAVHAISPEGMPWLRRSWEDARFDSLVAKLDLDLDVCLHEMRGLVGDQGPAYRLRTEQAWTDFFNGLNQPQIRASLTDRIEQRRIAVHAYLRQEGVVRDGAIGIVDLGWYQSCQSAFSRLVRLLKPDAEVRGYYLALSDGRGDYMKDSPAQALFHKPHPDRRAQCGSPHLFGRIPLMEHLLSCALHGTVHHYQVDARSGHTTAVTQPVSDAELGLKTDLLREIVLFAEKHCFPLGLSDRDSRDIIETLLATVALDPDPRWAELLSPIKVADDQNNRDIKSLVQPRRWHHVVRDLVRGHDPGSPGHGNSEAWPELSLSASSPSVRRSYKLVAGINAIRAAISWRLSSSQHWDKRW